MQKQHLEFLHSSPALCLLPVLAVSQSRAAPLSPPPYIVILISCSGLVSFVLLLLTCLCCKRGGVGFNVSLKHVRDSFTSPLFSSHSFGYITLFSSCFSCFLFFKFILTRQAKCNIKVVNSSSFLKWNWLLIIPLSNLESSVTLCIVDRRTRLSLVENPYFL